MGKCLLIIVNYNQEFEIGRVLDNVVEHQTQKDILIVDDGSVDSSPETARARGFRVIAHPRNIGVGAAIRTGLLDAIGKKYESVVIMAANGKMAPSDIPSLRAPIENGSADYVQGTRYRPGGSSEGLPLFRKAAIPIFSFFASAALGRSFSDISCGFRAYRLDLFKDTRFNIRQEWLNRYELEYYIHFWVCKLGYRIVEVPVSMNYAHLRGSRISKIKPIVGWWSMIRPFVFLYFGYRK